MTVLLTPGYTGVIEPIYPYAPGVILPVGAPQIGDYGGNGVLFQRAQNSRFPPPPLGQQYRVLPNDWLVLVDQRSLAVVAIFGLLSVLLQE